MFNLKILIHTLRKRWLWVLVWLFLILPTLGFLLVSCGLLVYMHWPRDFDDLELAGLITEREHLLLITHGVRDDTSSWVDPLIELYNKNNYQGQIIGLNWSAYANDSMSCATKADGIGEKVGERIAANINLESVHLIGHSCGAFIIFSACKTIKQLKPEIQVQTTYLDPVSVYGMSWDYGLEHFGSCADYSESYIDAEDNVPGSNQQLPLTYTYDLTKARKNGHVNISPHMWPTQYYQLLVAQNRAPSLRENPNLPSQLPAGSLQVVN